MRLEGWPQVSAVHPSLKTRAFLLQAQERGSSESVREAVQALQSFLTISLMDASLRQATPLDPIPVIPEHSEFMPGLSGHDVERVIRPDRNPV